VKLTGGIRQACWESELFGHEKGDSPERCAQPHWPVSKWRRWARFFLDEIEKYPSELRGPKLLACCKKESSSGWKLRRLRTDARMIGSTTHGFGSDGERAEVPIGSLFPREFFPGPRSALRNGSGYIPLLVRHFTQQFSRRMKRPWNDRPGQWMPCADTNGRETYENSECDRAGRNHLDGPGPYRRCERFLNFPRPAMR